MQTGASAVGPHELVNNTIVNSVMGVPWDARIHAASKSKVASGNWRNKPGVDPVYRAEIERELLAALAPAQTQPAQTLAPASALAAAHTASLAAALAPAQTQPVAPSLPVTYATLMNRIVQVTNGGFDMAPVMLEFGLQPGDYMALQLAHPTVLEGIMQRLAPANGQA